MAPVRRLELKGRTVTAEMTAQNVCMKYHVTIVTLKQAEV